ncbi:hypothetical protein CMQ_2562 [Grosmannia clavigera kw1407]|uniref:Mid2 domain-containing protein n=1 Tax=Grosmannia clavigera (strain kw1407 / UAMH 11150) TaxID=655863 RepID=F0XI79_GROCL|nr:uncharacterized protein CMQ_2562 [Grosmannia clavigera kw1407]EFX02633.1 hypothetical protein CMQ_2562 [Grosmannia clavigera kw1407]
MHLPRELAIVGAVASWFLATVATDVQEQAFRRALQEISTSKRDTVFRNSTSISKSFDGATLFDAAIDVGTNTVNAEVDVSVVCTTCYVRGSATAELLVDGTFNATEAILSVAQSVRDDVVNLTLQIENDVKATLVNDTAHVANLQFDEVQMPMIDVDLNLDVEGIPECQLAFSFDHLELFVQTQTRVGGAATYSLNLYTSETEVGIRVSDELEIGVVLTVDLIMSIDGAVEVDSGFHVKLDDGLVLTLDFFGKNVSKMEFNGGSFEFLPISTNAEATINAVLRVGVHAGLFLDIDPIKSLDLFHFAAGVDSVLFADVANITTSIAASSNHSAADDLGVDLVDCVLTAEEIYEFAIGAGAGASLVIADNSWGIGPTTVLPVWYTTVAQCATSTSNGTALTSASATATPAPAVRRADDSSVTSTIRTTFTFSAVGCRSAGIINCPASLQTTTVTKSESTMVTVVSSGAEASWPPLTATTVKAVSFGHGAKSIQLSASGTPSSFVPTTTAKATATGSSGSDGDTLSNDHHGGLTTTQKNIVIGVTVGVGVPLLAGILVGIIILTKHKKRQQQLGQPNSSSKVPSEQVVEVGSRD